MAYKPPKQTITDNDLKSAPSNEAVFEALKLKLPKPSVDGTNGQLLARGASADDTSWVNPPATGANTSLSNLSSVAINDNLAFNKATAAILSASDSKATQANHDLTIRAGNTGGAVSGGHLTLNSGTSTSGNGGSMYFNTTGGTRTGVRGFFFSVHTKNNKLVITDEELKFGSTVIFDASNTHDIGTTAQTANPRIVWVDTRVNLKNGAAITGDEEISSFGRAAGPLLLRGGDGVAGSTEARVVNPGGTATLRGGDHPANNTANAGSVIIRGGNKTNGNANGGDVTISGGLKNGTGNDGDVFIQTGGTTRLKIEATGNIQASGDLAFNKATAAIVNGSDAKATQANHDLTIRAGNTGSSVVGGNLYLYPGTSTNNGGSIYLDISGGTTSATRRIYFIGSGSTTVAEFQTNTARFNANLTFTTDNANTIGTFTANRPSQVFAATQMQIGTTSGVLSGLEKTDDNGSAPGSLIVRGGNGANSPNPRGVNPGGNLTLQGGDHAGATGTQGTQAAGNVTLRGGDKTAGTGNGGSVTISGGTSVGGTAGSIIANTAGAERMRITNTGDVKVVSGQLSVDTAGKGLSIKEGSNAKMGITGAFPTGTPNTVTVSTTAVTANSRIFLTAQSDPAGVNAALTISSVTAGTSFVIRASNSGFDGTVAWMIVEATP